MTMTTGQTPHDEFAMMGGETETETDATSASVGASAGEAALAALSEPGTARDTAASDAQADQHPQAVITEDDLVEYLVGHPDFFTRHGGVLIGLQIPDPNAGRAISLHERQLVVLREHHRNLDRRLDDLVRAGEENDAIADRLARFTRDLLLVRSAADMPARIEATLAESFRVPQVAVRLWHVGRAFADEAFVIAPDATLRTRTDDMRRPYCGLKNDLAPAGWFDSADTSARSMALIPLRRGAAPDSFGLIMLGSPDPDRFQTNMGTAFLERIAEVASAALSRLLPDGEGDADRV